MTTSPNSAAAGKRAASAHPSASFRWWREGLEAIAVALILAFLIRSFEAEAFVIPTGSMAPTLYGRHKDLICPQCGIGYQVGASEDAEEGRLGPVMETSCPNCAYPLSLDPQNRSGDRGFTGDRIIVDKLAYEGREPERWQVAVFKFPGGAKQNYIKRLVGLPGETIRIYQGDLYVKPNGAADTEFKIARKPPHTQWYMLQLVHDTDYLSSALRAADFPSRWFAPAGSAWEANAEQNQFKLPAGAKSWLRYQHVLPDVEEWDLLATAKGAVQLNTSVPELISDAYSYNSRRGYSESRDSLRARQRGAHWVGDLAIDTEITLGSDEGTLLLDLVEGGQHFECRIDVATGKVELEMVGGGLKFESGDGVDSSSLRTGATSIRGGGDYQVRFANADDRLLLWIDGELVTFDGPTTYQPGPQVLPKWSPTDPGDLHPIGVGGENLALTIKRLQVFRDIYYVAMSRQTTAANHNDYSSGQSLSRELGLHEIFQVFENPEIWSATELFKMRRFVDFELKDEDDDEHDQFFMLGDNSPESSDGRLWDKPEHFVERRLLIGRAVFVYWPHPLYWSLGKTSIPVAPNIPRMGLIH